MKFNTVSFSSFFQTHCFGFRLMAWRLHGFKDGGWTSTFHTITLLRLLSYLAETFLITPRSFEQNVNKLTSLVYPNVSLRSH